LYLRLSRSRSRSRSRRGRNRRSKLYSEIELLALVQIHRLNVTILTGRGLMACCATGALNLV
jgi:hypothetical protein